MPFSLTSSETIGAQTASLALALSLSVGGVTLQADSPTIGVMAAPLSDAPHVFVAASVDGQLDGAIGMRAGKEPIYDKSANAMLTDRVRATLARILPVIEKQARREFIPVQKTAIAGFVDPEEDSQEIVVTQWVGVSAAIALPYWDRLTTAIEIAAEYMPDTLKAIVLERIAIEVRWTPR